MDMEKDSARAEEQAISDIVGALFDPIIVFPGGWGETIPDWMKQNVTFERLLENMKTHIGEKPTGGDLEACMYLYTVSLSRPMGDQWSRIYLYLATQAMRRWQKAEVPANIAVDSISDYDLKALAGLKDFIYRKRLEHRKEKESGERREAREKAKEEGQPAKVKTKEAKDAKIKFF